MALEQLEAAGSPLRRLLPRGDHCDRRGPDLSTAPSLRRHSPNEWLRGLGADLGHGRQPCRAAAPDARRSRGGRKHREWMGGVRGPDGRGSPFGLPPQLPNHPRRRQALGRREARGRRLLPGVLTDVSVEPGVRSGRTLLRAGSDWRAGGVRHKGDGHLLCYRVPPRPRQRVEPKGPRARPRADPDVPSAALTKRHAARTGEPTCVRTVASVSTPGHTILVGSKKITKNPLLIPGDFLFVDDI